MTVSILHLGPKPIEYSRDCDLSQVVRLVREPARADAPNRAQHVSAKLLDVGGALCDTEAVADASMDNGDDEGTRRPSTSGIAVGL